MKVPQKIMTMLNTNPSHQYLDSLKIDVLKTVLLEADKVYYKEDEGTAINSILYLSDESYDVIKDFVDSKDPDFVKNNIGHDNMKNISTKVKLPVHMGSMDKKKIINKSLKNVVVTDKLDGVSCLIHQKPNKIPKLYTRGNGEYGRDISYLMKHFNHIDYEDKNEFMLRGELLLKKDIFEKYRCDESNPRNTVAGFVNSKLPDNRFKNHIDFVVYEVINPNGLKPDEQFKLLKNTKYKVVHNEFVEELDQTTVSNILNKRKKDSEYEIDGIIVAENVKYENVKSGNPKHAFAYKENNYQVLTEVKKVEWNVSKDGYLKPLVYFEPKMINNVKIEKATGHNAKFIVSNKIGKGSIIVIERSGDVIPKIVSVDTPAEPDMPERKYVWNDTNTDIMVGQNEDTDDANDVKRKQFEFLLTTLKFDHLGKGVIAKLYKSKIDSLVKLYSLSKDDILKIEGFKEKSADNLYKSIQKRRKELTMLDYMVASNIFGRGLGEKNLFKIIEKYPINSSFTVDDIVAIDGIGTIYAKKYTDALPKFKQFLVINKLDDFSKKQETVVENNDMKDLHVVFTGFRDKQLEECVNKKGGKIATSISNKITHLVCKGINEENSKQKKAKGMGIKILTRTEFENKYC